MVLTMIPYKLAVKVGHLEWLCNQTTDYCGVWEEITYTNTHSACRVENYNASISNERQWLRCHLLTAYLVPCRPEHQLCAAEEQPNPAELLE